MRMGYVILTYRDRIYRDQISVLSSVAVSSNWKKFAHAQFSILI